MPESPNHDVRASASAGPRAITESIRLRLRVPARLRNLELLLVIVAVAINLGSIALVQLGAIGHLGFTVLGLSGLLGVLVFAMHITLRVTARDADPLILPIITV